MVLVDALQLPVPPHQALNLCIALLQFALTQMQECLSACLAALADQDALLQHMELAQGLVEVVADGGELLQGQQQQCSRGHRA
jgi:hypothetical protein